MKYIDRMALERSCTIQTLNSMKNGLRGSTVYRFNKAEQHSETDISNYSK